MAHGEATHESVVGGDRPLPPPPPQALKCDPSDIYFKQTAALWCHSERPRFPLPTQLHILMDWPALTVRSLQTSARPEQGNRRKSTVMNRRLVELNTVTAQIYSVRDLQKGLFSTCKLQLAPNPNFSHPPVHLSITHHGVYPRHSSIVPWTQPQTHHTLHLWAVFKFRKWKTQSRTQ